MLVVIAGCSSAPSPRRIEATPPSPTSSAPASAIAGAVSAVAAPNAEEDDAPSDVDDLVHRTDKLALDDGAELVVVLGQPAEPDGALALTMALIRGGKVISRRDDFAAVTGVKATLLTSAQPCERSVAGLRRESFGRVAGVRVSIVCATGEDYFTSTELAVLFRLDGPVRDLDALPRIWAGLAATERNDMDSCMTSREVAFQVIDAKTLEKTITEQTRWVEQTFGGDLKKRLKKGCKVGTSKRVERVALP
jgi:hypothetical protein